MEYRTTITFDAATADPDIGLAVLQGLERDAAELSPVVSQDAEARTLTVTLSIESRLGEADMVFSHAMRIIAPVLRSVLRGADAPAVHAELDRVDAAVAA